MVDPKDMIVPMLQEMREENRQEFGEVKGRLDKIEKGQKSLRNAMTADTMMSKFMLGDYEERLQQLEAKVEKLIKTK
jgi:tetrahydromethanopterin S-methyltransferase subunit G